LSEARRESNAPNAPWTVQRVLTWAAEDLRSRGSETPRLDAELMLAHVLDTTRINLIIDAKRPLEKSELSAYRELHKRRRAGEPIAYIRGVREFYGRPFIVDRRVLVPRPDTEVLVEVSLRRTRHLSLSARGLDLGTGSGCIAITLVKERPTTQVLGIDTSADALDVARENATRLSAVPAVGFQLGNFGEGLPDAAYDLVVSNPPYIPEAEHATLEPDVRDFEPRLALTPGPTGLESIEQITADAPRLLAPGGLLALEVMLGQAQDVARMLADRGLCDVEVDKDYAGIERVVSGRLAAP